MNHVTHFDSTPPHGLAQSLCGWVAPKSATHDPRDVTCLQCRRMLDGSKTGPQSADVGASCPKTPEGGVGSALPTAGLSRADRKRWREILEGLADIIVGNYSGDRPRPPRETRWASVGHALTGLVENELDGYRVPSLADPDRIKRLMAHSWETASAKSDTGYARQVDDLDPVRKAWERAYEGPIDGVPETLCRLACLARWVGIRQLPGDDVGDPKPVFVLVRQSNAQIAAMLSLGLGRGVAPKTIGRIVRSGQQRVYEYLRGDGRALVPVSQPVETTKFVQQESDMGVREGLLCGWAEIAAHVEMSIRAAQAYAKREPDPLPLFNRVGGKVYADPKALAEWWNRQLGRQCA